MFRTVSLALAFVAMCRGQIQPPTNKGSIEGRVTTPGGDPLPSATVKMILVGAAGPSEQNSWTAQSDCTVKGLAIAGHGYIQKYGTAPIASPVQPIR